MTLHNAFTDLADTERQDAAKVTLDAILAKIIAAPATAAGQSTQLDKLEAIRLLLIGEGGYLDGVEGLLGAIGTALAGTLAVSATALPLPAGAATSAAQAAAQTTFAAILAKLIASPATEGKQDAGNTSLAAITTALVGTLAISAAALPLPAGAATAANQTAASYGAALTQTVVTLTANQIAGTDPLVAANATRRSIQFSATRDFYISLASGAAAGMQIFASARDDLVGKLCPVGAIYLATGSGFAVGSTVTIWEG